MTPQNKIVYKHPRIFIFSANSRLHNDVREFLKDNHCETVTLPVKEFSQKNYESLRNAKDSTNNYFLFLLNFINEKDANHITNNLRKTIDFIKKIDAKAIFVFPKTFPKNLLEYYEYWQEHIRKDGSLYKGIVYLGDILPELPAEDVDSYLDKMISEESVNKSILNISGNGFIYPLSSSSASKILVSLLFSMSAYNSETTVIGKQTTLDYLNRQVFSDKHHFFVKNENTIFEKLENSKDVRSVNEDINELIEKRRNWQPDLEARRFVKDQVNKKRIFNKRFSLFSSKIIKSIKTKAPKQDYVNRIDKTETLLDHQTKRLGKTEKLKKFVVIAIITALILFTSPFLLMHVSRATLLASGLLMNKAEIKGSRMFLTIAKYSSKGASNMSVVFTKAPLVGDAFYGFYRRSELLVKISELQKDYLDVLGDTATFIMQLGGGSDGDNLETIRNIALEIDNIYTKTGFLEGEMLKDNNETSIVNNKMFLGMKDSGTKNKLLLLMKILNESASLLGVDKPSNYLLLFEDSSEIKPTGGKIYAFGVLTLADAKISNIQFFNFDDVNKKIVGKVEPPEPLKKYFEKDFWYMADSNWYADFPSSAEKSEWFLDKGLDISVNGVISLDTTAIDDIASITKAVGINDDGSSDHHELIDFINQISGQDKNRTYKLMFRFLKLLDEKHALVFVHNNITRAALNDLGWDGSIKSVNCADDCFLDTVGFIESANGIGSESIKKEITLRVSVEEGLVKKELNVYMENGNNFDYKTYARVLSDANSGFSPIKIVTEKEELEKYPDIYGVSGYKEAGTYLEFKPLETKMVSFTWENSINDFSLIKRYSVLFRKQPGENKYPIEIDVKSNSKKVERTTPSYSLTSDGVWSYNTNLLSDFESTFIFK